MFCLEINEATAGNHAHKKFVLMMTAKKLILISLLIYALDRTVPLPFFPIFPLSSLLTLRFPIIPCPGPNVSPHTQSIFTSLFPILGNP